MDGAERTFAALAGGSLDEAYNDLQYLVQDDTNVHRVVLAWRAWALLDLTGKEHAHTLLRQSVRFCVDEEGNLKKNHSADPLRALLPKLLDQYRLLDRPAGRPAAGRRLGRAASARRSTASSREKAADAVAAALAEGIAPGGHRRGDLAGGQPARPPRPRPAEGRLAREAEGQRPRRLGRRPRLRRGQRLAEHRPRQQPAQRAGQPDRRGLPHRRAVGRA